MATILRTLSALLVIGLAITAFGSWLGVVVYGFRALRRPRPGVSLWSRTTVWNPANALLRPELLTADGRRYRDRCLRALFVFVTCIVSGFLVGAVARSLQ